MVALQVKLKVDLMAALPAAPLEANIVCEGCSMLECNNVY